MQTLDTPMDVPESGSGKKGQVYLRDRGPLAQPLSVGNKNEATFLIGANRGFDGLGAGPSGPTGHLSQQAYDRLMQNLADASRAPTPATREVQTARAAEEVAHALIKHNGHARGPLQTSQVAFSGRELRDGIAQRLRDTARDARHTVQEGAAKLGLSPTSSYALAVSFQKALEQQGIKTLVNHALDGSGKWQASAATAVTQLGQRFHLEKAATWLAQHGMNAQTMRNLAAHHQGKIGALVTVAQHGDFLAHTAKQLSNAGLNLHAISQVLGDKAVRQGLGDILMGSGNLMTGMPGLRAVGSFSILAGSLIKGEASEETVKHLLRAGAAVLGGMAGAAVVGGATAGAGTFVGGAVGAELGASAMDKLITWYEKKYEPEVYQQRMAQAQANAQVNTAENVANLKAAATDLANNATIKEVGGERLAQAKEVAHKEGAALAAKHPDLAKDTKTMGVELQREMVLAQNR